MGSSGWAGLLSGTGGALAAAYGLLARGDDAVAPRYTTARVERGPITATVTATGTVNPVAAVIVGTYVSGPVQEVFVDYNAPIHKGQLLARIDPRPFQTKVDAAEADLATARPRVEKSRADLPLRQAAFRRQRALPADTARWRRASSRRKTPSPSPRPTRVRPRRSSRSKRRPCARRGPTWTRHA